MAVRAQTLTARVATGEGIVNYQLPNDPTIQGNSVRASWMKDVPTSSLERLSPDSLDPIPLDRWIVGRLDRWTRTRAC
jgi:hypothetical protein